MRKLLDTKNREEVRAIDMRDSEVVAELARTAIANQLAILVIQYRVKHNLTQTSLARKLGMRQPAIARLEAGEHEPTVTMLARLADKLDIAIHLDVSRGTVALVTV